MSAAIFFVSHTSPATADIGASSRRGLTSTATKQLLLAVGALGVSCVATQLVLMREMLCVFAGNELVLGIVLGNWLLLMGAGAWLGRRTERAKDRQGSFLLLQIAIGVLPVMTLTGVRSLRLGVFPPGVAIGITGTFISSLVVLLPYCLAAGFLLALACAVAAEASDRSKGPGHVYVADSVGSILGGAVFSLVLVRVLDSFVLLAVIGFLNLALAGLLAWQQRRKLIVGAALAATGSLVLIAFTYRPDVSTTDLLYASETILFRGSSPYGQLVVTSANGQTNFIQNGLPVLSTHNIEQVEEAVHYAMAQRPDARRVLLVGGGVAGTANELLKYPAEITYVELDPLFLRLGRRFLPQNLADPRIHIENTDGRRFVQTTCERFDVVIVDLADPVTAQLNRFHTAEFCAEAKRVLATNGVLALAIGRYEDFVSPELAQLLATEHRTLRSVYASVIMVPGGRVFFLASDGALGLDITKRLERAQIDTRFVNRHYLDAMLTSDRLADLERAVVQRSAINRDFDPTLYFRCLRHWASQFDTRLGIAPIALGLVLVVYVVRLRGASAAVFAGGFAASSLEVVLLLGFQALCGSLYYQLGIIVTVFMAGLAVGAVWANRGGTFVAAMDQRGNRGDATNPERDSDCDSSASIASRRLSSRRLLVLLALAIAVWAAVLPGALRVLSKAPLFGGPTVAVQVAIGFLTFALAALVGAEFPVANRVEHDAAATASRIYTADFVGASVGALLASAWLIPVLGVTMMCWLVAGLNLLGAAAVVLARPKPL